jgi:hypothetical protein
MNAMKPRHEDEPQMNSLMNGAFDLAPINRAFLVLRRISVSM